MWSCGHLIGVILISCLPFGLLVSSSTTINRHDNDDGLSRFVSRPDIRAPKWEVNVYQPELVSPGYWFIGPYESFPYFEKGNGWIGPHIYDHTGQLVWSGVDVADNSDALDFRVNNVLGEDMLSYAFVPDGNAYFLDQSYQIRKTIHLGTLDEDFNGHELSVVDEGKKLLYIYEAKENAPWEEAVALDQADCKVSYIGFKELDAENEWQEVFDWMSWGRIRLNESTMVDGGITNNCRQASYGWDYLHMNAVDKDHLGNYIISARNTDTIYKISKNDGHIMWRLSGNENNTDFEMDGLTFSRQHNVRFQGFNGTHEIISFLDNARGEDSQRPTWDHSRGLVLALDMQAQPKPTAQVILSIDHPHGPGHYAQRRGNFQMLPNGNIWMGWSEQARQSEHTSTGEIVMEAELVTQWLGTYRSFKFPWTGLPTERPQAASAVYRSHADRSFTTLVHVSQNGATEIAHWNLYRTTATGSPRVLVVRKGKAGFETEIAYDGFAGHILVEAIDQDGNILGTSNVVETVLPGDVDLMPEIADEVYWFQKLGGDNIQDVHMESQIWPKTDEPIPKNHRLFETVLVLGTICTLILVWQLRIRKTSIGRSLTHRYHVFLEDVPTRLGKYAT